MELSYNGINLLSSNTDPINWSWVFNDDSWNDRWNNTIYLLLNTDLISWRWDFNDDGWILNDKWYRRKNAIIFYHSIKNENINDVFNNFDLIREIAYFL